MLPAHYDSIAKPAQGSAAAHGFVARFRFLSAILAGVALLSVAGYVAHFHGEEHSSLEARSLATVSAMTGCQDVPDTDTASLSSRAHLATTDVRTEMTLSLRVTMKPGKEPLEEEGILTVGEGGDAWPALSLQRAGLNQGKLIVSFRKSGQEGVVASESLTFQSSPTAGTALTVSVSQFSCTISRDGGSSSQSFAIPESLAPSVDSAPVTATGTWTWGSGLKRKISGLQICADGDFYASGAATVTTGAPSEVGPTATTTAAPLAAPSKTAAPTGAPSVSALRATSGAPSSSPSGSSTLAPTLAPVTPFPTPSEPWQCAAVWGNAEEARPQKGQEIMRTAVTQKMRVSFRIRKKGSADGCYLLLVGDKQDNRRPNVNLNDNSKQPGNLRLWVNREGQQGQGVFARIAENQWHDVLWEVDDSTMTLSVDGAVADSAPWSQNRLWTSDDAPVWYTAGYADKPCVDEAVLKDVSVCHQPPTPAPTRAPTAPSNTPAGSPTALTLSPTAPSVGPTASPTAPSTSPTAHPSLPPTTGTAPPTALPTTTCPHWKGGSVRKTQKLFETSLPVNYTLRFFVTVHSKKSEWTCILQVGNKNEVRLPKVSFKTTMLVNMRNGGSKQQKYSKYMALSLGEEHLVEVRVRGYQYFVFVDNELKSSKSLDTWHRLVDASAEMPVYAGSPWKPNADATVRDLTFCPY